METANSVQHGLGLENVKGGRLMFGQLLAFELLGPDCLVLESLWLYRNSLDWVYLHGFAYSPEGEFFKRSVLGLFTFWSELLSLLITRRIMVSSFVAVASEVRPGFSYMTHLVVVNYHPCDEWSS